MNDQDYIRKAVELADGFIADKMNAYYWCGTSGDEVATDVDDPEQWFKDALATQLVRQVDALENIYIEFDHPEVSRKIRTFDSYGVIILDDEIGFAAKAYGPDRTMNTIKAIVDSSVLITGENGND